MLDNEYRIVLTGDRNSVEQVGIFFVDDDGQVSLVDAWELAPFDTKSQLMHEIIRRVVAHNVSVGARWN